MVSVSPPNRKPLDTEKIRSNFFHSFFLVRYAEEAELLIKRSDLPPLLKKTNKIGWKGKLENAHYTSSVGVLIDMGLGVSPFMNTQVTGNPFANRIDSILINAQQFLYHAAQILMFTKPRNNRARHLVALPLLGTGGAGLVTF